MCFIHLYKNDFYAQIDIFFLLADAAEWKSFHYCQLSNKCHQGKQLYLTTVYTVDHFMFLYSSHVFYQHCCYISAYVKASYAHFKH